MTALGGGVEHQKASTPHIHVEGHVVCMYQFHTLADIASKIKEGLVTVSALKAYQEWLHCEDILDSEVYNHWSSNLEQEWQEKDTNKSAFDTLPKATAEQIASKTGRPGLSTTTGFSYDW